MARGHARAAGTDARVIEIDTDRVLARKQRHFAVIDVGSNSIRLVVYDDLSRAPFPRFNEKSFVALGAGLDASGRLSGKAIDMAVRAVRRFESIARAMQVETVHVLATEATRRATNGADLVAAIREATGLEPRVLSGPEEATYAALGVISGFFQPKGLAGDMGGGSLEVAEVVGDRVGERMVSMPLGALPVRAMLAEGVDTAKKQIDALLDARLPPLADRPGLLRDRRWLAGAGARAHRADRRADQRGARPRRRGRRGAGARQEDLADDAGGGGGAARRAEPARRHAAGRGRGATPGAEDAAAGAGGVLAARAPGGVALRPARRRGALSRPAARGGDGDRAAERPGAGVQRGAGALDRRPVPGRDAGRPAAAARRLRADRHRLARPREGARDRELPPAAAVPVHRHLAPRAGVSRGGDPRPLRRQRRRRGPERGPGPARPERAAARGDPRAGAAARAPLLGQRAGAARAGAASASTSTRCGSRC